MSLGRQLDLERVPPVLRPELLAAIARFEQASDATIALDRGLARQLPKVWACSRFVADACARDPSLLGWLAGPGQVMRELDAATLAAELTSVLANATEDAAWLDALRIFRRLHLARIAWRDLAGITDIGTVLRETSTLADVCVRAAYARAEGELAARHGAPIDAQGERLGIELARDLPGTREPAEQ